MRMRVGGFGVCLSELAVFVSCSCVMLRLFVFAYGVVMPGLMMMMGGGVVVSGG
jgi:hypothetical protein